MTTPEQQVPSATVAEKPNASYLLAIDIECSGPELGRPIMAIGACFGQENGTVLDKRSFCGTVPRVEEFDPKTWEFWSQFPDVLLRINEQAEPNHEMAFYNWLVALNEVYGPFGKDTIKLRLLSDNPGYDLAKIAVRFYHHIGPSARTVAEMFGTYVPTSDPSEQEASFSAGQLAVVRSYMTAPHSHEPSDDATQIFQNYIGVQEVLNQSKNHK